MAWTREQMAQRAAKELRDGYYVNLGIGIPTLVANYIPDGVEVTLQSENGMLGMGPFPYEGEDDADLINAGKQTITELPKTSYFSSADIFAMIRGGHIDLSILGAMEVAANGDLANWMIPARWSRAWAGRWISSPASSGHRGHGAHLQGRRVQAAEACTLPLTGAGVVDLCDNRSRRVRASARTAKAFEAIELAPGVTSTRSRRRPGRRSRPRRAWPPAPREREAREGPDPARAARSPR